MNCGAKEIGRVDCSAPEHGAWARVIVIERPVEKSSDVWRTRRYALPLTKTLEVPAAREHQLPVTFLPGATFVIDSQEFVPAEWLPDCAA